MHSPAQLSPTDFLAACRAYVRSDHDHTPATGPSAQPELGARLYARGWALDESRTHFGPQFAFLHRSLPVQVRLNAAASKSSTEDEDGGLNEDWVAEADDAALSMPAGPQAGPVPDLGALSVDGAERTPTASPSLDARPTMALMSQSICYSSTWKVPVFYFTVSRTDGTPFTLDQIIRSSIVQHDLDPLTERAGQHRQPGAAHGRSESASTAIPDPSSSSPSQAAVQTNDLPATFAPISSTEHPVTGKPSLFLHPCETSSWLEVLLLPQAARRDARTAMARASSSSSLGHGAALSPSTAAAGSKPPRPVSAGKGASDGVHPVLGSGLRTSLEEGDPCTDHPQRSRIVPSTSGSPPLASTADGSSPTAASAPPADAPEQALVSYLETFVALVASAIEMRL